jgi:serine/threonine-protein kinase HipA
VPRTLDVYLDQELVGQLIQDDDGQMTFGYAASWLERGVRFAISHSLPLRPERFPQNSADQRPERLRHAGAHRR